MLKTRIAVARAVAVPLVELEKHLDAAIAGQAAVQVAAIEGRREAKLPLEAGQEAMALMAQATVSMLAAREAVHRAHRLFRQAQTNMGVGPISYGDFGDSPEETFAPMGVAERPALAVVADAA